MTKIVCLPGGLTTNGQATACVSSGFTRSTLLGWWQSRLTAESPGKKDPVAPCIYINVNVWHILTERHLYYSKPFRFLYLLDRDHTSIVKKLRTHPQNHVLRNQHGLVDVQWTAGTLGRWVGCLSPGWFSTEAVCNGHVKYVGTKHIVDIGRYLYARAEGCFFFFGFRELLVLETQKRRCTLNIQVIR